MFAAQRHVLVGLVIIWFGFFFISREQEGSYSAIRQVVNDAELQQMQALYPRNEPSSGKEIPSTRSGSGERIRGNLNAPLEGKPVAPVDFSWDFICEPGSLFAIQGKIIVTNHGTLGDITVHVSGREGFLLLSADTFTASAISQGGSVEIPVEGHADLPANRGKLVLVASHVVHGTERVRVISIDFARQPRSPATLPDGASIITDDQGEKILLQPASRR